MSNLLAFSTLGCPSWDLDRILSAAQEYGYDAIELRGYRDSMDLPTAGPFAPSERARTLRRLQEGGAAVCCVSSSATVIRGDLEAVRSHSRLARDLDCPLVRIFGGALDNATPREAALDRAAVSLREFGDAAQDEGVQLVLETHDFFSTGRAVADLIAAAGHPSVRSLWDLHHPYREGEPMQETLRALRPTLAHLHVKDSRVDGGYTLSGDGDIPLFEMLDLALDAGYAGAISLEWEKRWHPEIAEPEIAFPQYARALRDYLDGRARREGQAQH